MSPFTHRIDPETGSPYLAVSERGEAVLRDPFLNKGEAFTGAERDSLGLRGLLPDSIATIEQQMDRVQSQFALKTTDIGTNVYLFDDASDTYVNDFLFGGGDDELLFRAQANGDHFDLDGIELTNIERLTFDTVGTGRDVTVEIDPDEVTITGSELSNTLAVTAL